MILAFNPSSVSYLFRLPCGCIFKALHTIVRNSSCSTSIPKTSDRPNKSVVYCNREITRHGRSGNISEAEAIFHSMRRKSVVSYTAMLSAYADNGQIENSRKVFDEMPQRTIASWNAMITGYVRNMSKGNDIEKAVSLFRRMPERNAVSYTVMVMGLVNSSRFDEAQRLYEGMPVKWMDPFCSNVMINGYLKIRKLEEAVRIFERMVEKNVVSWSTMVDGYCKNGRLTEARKLFDTMDGSRNQVTWCSMIDGYMKEGCFDDGFLLFLQMRREGCLITEPTTVTAIFDSCGRNGRYKEGYQVHGLVSHLGLDFDVFLGNSLISMYSRFGWVDEARNMFNTLREKDVVSWNSMISAYVQAGLLDEAYELFDKTDSKDPVSWTTILTALARGSTEKCIHLFNNMPERDDVAWTALVSGFVKCGQHEEAILWFVQMLQNAVRPNPLTLSSSLSASASLAYLSLGQQIHAVVYKLLMEHDLSIQNSLVSMYSKNGSVSDAYRIFSSITTPNIVSINSMITGFAHNGFGEEALELFRQWVDGGQAPDEVTFLGVLSACAHVGRVEDGWHYFKSMRTFFKVEPGLDHYACMVDLLGRAGLLDEATELIKTIPVEPHSGVWGAILGASRKQMNLDLAKLAAQRISELEPDNAAPYVVVSDICSFIGKKKDEEEIRLSKRLRGIKKSPGCSWIRVKDEVKLFLSGDKSHSNYEEISRALWIVKHEISQSEYIELDCVFNLE